MYAEEYEKRGFPLKDFLLKLVLVIIFVALLCWLLPKFIKPTIVNECKNTGSSAGVCDTSGLDALTSQIFSDNLEKMKNAAISFYTDDRLPQNVGDSETMTLSDMIGKHLLVPLIDKNNKACDVTASYVKITKNDDEYIMKVNLKDSEKEDYILVHLGCYTYCDSYICEKRQEKGFVKGGSNTGTYYKPTKTVPIKIYPSNDPTPTPSHSEKYYCSIVNGKYYDNAGKITTKSKWLEKCETKPTPKYYCSIVNGKYYGKDGSVVSKETYKSQCETEPTISYLYQYKKVTEAKFSAWTAWSAWAKTSCSTQEINCNEASISCLRKLQTTSRKEKIGEYDKKYIKTRSVLRQTGSYTQKACSKYNYVIVNNTTYATTTSTTYTVVNTITKTTQHTTGNWVYSGRGSYTNPPRDSANTSYKFVGADYSYCNETCTSLPNYYYDKYTYTGGMTSVANTTSTPSWTSTTSTSTSSSSEVTVDASCGSYEIKTIPIYAYIEESEIDTRREPLYGTVCYSSEKTRSLISKGTITYKWSTSDHSTKLINEGWTYTGVKKVA